MARVVMKSPVSCYYGGKSKLAKTIADIIPQHSVYVEPFFGGGSVFFAKPPSKVNIINDSNGFVTNFWQVFFNEEKRAKMVKILDSFIYSEVNYKEARKIMKNQEEYSDIDRAWAFFFLANSVFTGDMNSGFAYSYNINYGLSFFNKVKRLKHYKNIFNKVTIFNRDVLEVMTMFQDKEVFFYLDPPYFNSDMGHYKGYTEQDFTALLDIISKIKGKFLLSSYPSKILASYIDKHNWKYYQIKQVVSAKKAEKGESRNKMKIEQLTYNYELPQMELYD